MKAYIAAMWKLMRGLVSIHPFWAAFIQLLILLHGIAPFFFLPRPLAIVVLVCFYAGALTMVWLTMKYGFSRILGAAHIWWIPMLGLVVWSFSRITNEPPAYQIWVWSLLIIQPITLIFDGWDILRWLRGDRAEMVSGL